VELVDAMASRVGSDSSIEPRDPRFAELDAQIKADQAIQQRRTAPKAKRQRRQAGPRIPATVRKEVSRCARQLRKHGKLFFADDQLKNRVARVLRSMLPPKRKRGRPGNPMLTKAILLLKKLQHEYQEQERKDLWQQVYRQVIPDYANLPREQQRGAGVAVT
jgi:hypothetical protein